jgi:hypothetical protein
MGGSAVAVMVLWMVVVDHARSDVLGGGGGGEW